MRMLLRNHGWLIALIVGVLVHGCEVAAQGLPGPAAEGWFVLMALDPSIQRCTAHVLPSSQRGKSKIGNLRVSKRFGPYATMQLALEDLQTAGWTCSVDVACPACGGVFCLADIGC
jgi:hypothetical protein